MRSDREQYQVTFADAVCAHQAALLSGGLPGVLNENGIRSALGRPYHGYYEQVHEKAAALMHAVVSNHGYADGNKRTACMLALLLIRRSGSQFIGDKKILADTVCGVAQGAIGVPELAAWLRDRIVFESAEE